MWVIYFQGKPTYWLQCDKLYTIGRKDTDVVILEDASISRLHMKVTVGAVGTIAAVGKHMAGVGLGGGRGATARGAAVVGNSPSKKGAADAGDADEEVDNDDEEGVADRVAAVLGSVTSKQELSALFPSAPLIFQDLSKYGSTLEFTDNSALASTQTQGARQPATASVPRNSNASFSPATPAAAFDGSNNNTRVVRLKNNTVAVTTPNGAPIQLNSTSPTVGTAAASVAHTAGLFGSVSADGSAYTLPSHLHACRLRVGTHEAVFEFKWEPFFILLGQTEGGGNNTTIAGQSTHEWVLRSVAKCGFIVLNAKRNMSVERERRQEWLKYIASSAAAGGDGGGEERTTSPPPQHPNTAIAVIPHSELPTHIFRMAAFLLTSEINPTPLLMAALCAAKPIVGFQYLESLLSRVSPIIPLQECSSPLATPKKIHAFFTQLLGVNTLMASRGGGVDGVGGGAGALENDQMALSSSFLARGERSRLFSLTTFVAVQTPVYEELKSYIPLADGHMIYDDYLSKACKALENYFALHQQQQQNGSRATTPTARSVTVGNANSNQQQQAASSPSLTPSTGGNATTTSGHSSGVVVAATPAAALAPLIDAFLARHGNRVIVYLPTKNMHSTTVDLATLPPEVIALRVLIQTVSTSSNTTAAGRPSSPAKRLGGGHHNHQLMPTVEYTSLLSSIVRARKLNIVYNNTSHHHHHQQHGGAALGAMGSGILGGGGHHNRKSGRRDGDGSASGESRSPQRNFAGRRTENGNVFDDDYGDDENIDVDATIDPVAGSGNRTQNNHNNTSTHANNKSGGALGGASRLLITDSGWKSRDDLRAPQSSTVLLPDGSRAFLHPRDRNRNGEGMGKGDDDDDYNDDGDDLFSSHNNNRGSGGTASSPSSSAKMRMASKAQLVAYDPLSGALAASGRDDDHDDKETNANDDDNAGNEMGGGGGDLNAPFINPKVVIETDDIIMAGPPKLPPYPCFQKWTATDGGAVGDASSATLAGVSQFGGGNGNGKAFRKQRVYNPPEIIELQPDGIVSSVGGGVGNARAAAAVGAGGMGLGIGIGAGNVVHVSAADDDIIPDHVASAPLRSAGAGAATTSAAASTSYFNPYDVATHNRIQRRAGGHAARREEINLLNGNGGAEPSAGRGRGRGRGRGAATAASHNVHANADSDLDEDALHGNNAATVTARGRTARSITAVAATATASVNSSGAGRKRNTATAGAASAMLTAAANAAVAPTHAPPQLALRGGGGHTIMEEEDDDDDMSLTAFARTTAGAAGAAAPRRNAAPSLPPPLSNNAFNFNSTPMPDTQQALNDIFDVDNLY